MCETKEKFKYRELHIEGYLKRTSVEQREYAE